MNPLILACLALPWVALGLLSAAPGVVGGDSPELTAAAFHLGSAHAPGYPLYVGLGHLFQLLPLGTPAFRMTFLSILVQAGAFVILVQTLYEFLSPSFPERRRQILAILSASLVFAGPLFFHQLNSPEVFALHLGFVTLLLRLVLFPTPAHFFAAAFIAGLSLSHQHLTLLILPALFWANRARLKQPPNFLRFLAFLLLGLTPYLLLPLRAVQLPPVNWGNPVNFHQFLYHLSRAQYGGDLTSGPLINGFWDLALYLKMAALENAGLGIFLMSWGWWKGRRAFQGEYYLGGLCLFLLLPFLIRAPLDPQNNHVNAAFLPPALLWFSPLVLAGLVQARMALQRLGRWLFFALLIFIITLGGFSLRQNKASRNLAVEDLGLDILFQLPNHSVLYSDGDAITFPLAYLHLVRQLRPGVEIIDRTGGLFRNLYGLLDYGKSPGATPYEMVSRELTHEREEHPSAVFYTENTRIPGRKLEPVGVLFQAETEKATPVSEPLLWGDFRVPRVQSRHDYFSRETGARYYFFKAPFELDVRGNIPQGLGDLQLGKDLAFDNSRLWLIAGLVEFNHGLTEQAERTFEKSTRLNPLDPLAWYNRGIAAEKSGHFGDSITYFKKMIPLAPQNAAAHLQLGRLYSKTGKGDEAVQEWETTRQLDPPNGLAYRELGLYFQSRKPDYAAQMIRQYLELTPDAPDKRSLASWLATQPR